MKTESFSLADARWLEKAPPPNGRISRKPLTITHREFFSQGWLTDCGFRVISAKEENEKMFLGFYPEILESGSSWKDFIKNYVFEDLLVAEKVIQDDAYAEIRDRLSKAIKSSRYITGLHDDWDERGSPGYQKATWERACSFLWKLADLAVAKRNIIDIPKIQSGPKGSIDLHWKTPNYELLINFPEERTKPASFYGDNYYETKIEGSFDPDDPLSGSLLWLSQKM